MPAGGEAAGFKRELEEEEEDTESKSGGDIDACLTRLRRGKVRHELRDLLFLL
jgi:hypothetical protein